MWGPLLPNEAQIQQQTQAFVRDQIGDLILVNARLRAEVSVLAAALARAQRDDPAGAQGVYEADQEKSDGRTSNL